MVDTDVTNVSVDSIEYLTAADVLEAIIKKCYKHYQERWEATRWTSIYEFLNKNLGNANLTKITIMIYLEVMISKKV